MKWTGISNSATKRRGFSLIELAIVIGIIGLLLGSIWAFASQSWENARQEKFKDETLSIVKSVRGYYSGRAGISGTFATATQTAITANLIPSSIIRTGGGCGSSCADSPWGATIASAAAGSLGICSWTAGTSLDCTTNGTNTPLFAIEIQGIPLGSCIKVATRNSDANAPAGFYDVVINRNSMGALGKGLPPLISDVEAKCSVTVPATIDFVYRLTQPQT